MSHSYFVNSISFIVESLFYFYMVVISLRLAMQWAHWEYHHPLVQFIIRATQAPVKFLRQFLPSIGRWDTATIALLIAVSSLKLVVLGLLAGVWPSGLIWVSLTIAEIFSLFIDILTVSIIAEVIFSWVRSYGSYNSFMPMVQRMNAPLLRPIRQLISPFGGVDLSPLFVILGLQVLSMVIMPLLLGEI